MATYYWVSRGILFSSSVNDSGNWSSSSGGGGGAGVPGSGDDIVFDGNSFITTSLLDITFDGSGFACNNITFSGLTVTPTINYFSAISIFGSLFINASLNSSSAGGTWNFVGTGTITTNGFQPTNSWAFAGTYTLADNLIFNAIFSRNIFLNGGTLNLNGRNLTCWAFISNNVTARTLAFNGGVINLFGNNVTIWNLGGITNFSYTGTPVVNATYSGSTGTRIINNGGSLGGNETNAISFNITAGTDSINFATSDTNAIKNLNFTGFTGILSNTARSVYGNLTFSSGMTFTGGVLGTLLAATSGTQLITSNGNTLDFPVVQKGVGGTVQLQDNLTIGSDKTFALTAGTLNLNNQTLSAGTFSSSNSNTRSIAFGAGQINVTGNSATVWSTSTSTNLSITGTPTVNLTYSGPTGTRSVAAGTLGEALALSFNVTAGTDTVTLNNNTTYRNLNFTGFSGTLTNNPRTIYGNLTASSGMTFSSGASATTFASTSGTKTITTVGRTLDFPVTFNGVGGTWQLQDSFTLGSTRSLTLTNGALNANNQNVTCGVFSSSNANTRTLTMGSGAWTIQSTGTAWNCSTGTGLTLNADTSTINLTSTALTTFAGGGKIYNVVNRGGAGDLTITGANTFNIIQNTAQPFTLTFPANTVQTITNFNISGVAGSKVAIQSSIANSKATINCPTFKTIQVSNCTIKDISATGASWLAYEVNGNENLNNNFGWVFGNEFFMLLLRQ